MGQYHCVLNFDKKEMLHPHSFGDGLKLMEFGQSGDGTMAGLAVLLAASNRGGPRGGGDLHPWISGFGAHGDGRQLEGDPAFAQALMDHVVGRWAGDRIGILGDYMEGDDIPGITDAKGAISYYCDSCGETYSTYRVQCDAMVDVEADSTCGGHVYTNNLYGQAGNQENGWVDISEWVVQALELDYHVAMQRHKLIVWHEDYASFGGGFGGRKRLSSFDPATGKITPVAKRWGEEAAEVETPSWCTFTYDGIERMVRNFKLDYKAGTVTGLEVRRGAEVSESVKTYKLAKIKSEQ